MLVVGGDGMVGDALAQAFTRAGHKVTRTSRRRCAPKEGSVYFDLNESAPTTIDSLSGLRTAVLCAAVTSTAACEAEPDRAWQTNVERTTELAAYLIDKGIFTLVLSTNLVFNGVAPFAKPTNPWSPRGEYGRGKAEVERRLLGFGPHAAIVRFAKIIPPRMPLFMTWSAELGARRPVRAFSDRFIAPVSLAFAVNVIVEVARREAGGITQVSACEEVSYYDAALHLASRLGVSANLVAPVSVGDDVGGQGPHSTLDLGALRALGFDAPLPRQAFDQLDLSGIEAGVTRAH